MKHALPLAASALCLAAMSALSVPRPAQAIECAQGVYRAGCAGPNGAAVVRRPDSPTMRYESPATVTCAKGVYRAGCAGPNGAAVVRRY